MLNEVYWCWSCRGVTPRLVISAVSPASSTAAVCRVCASRTTRPANAQPPPRQSGPRKGRSSGVRFRKIPSVAHPGH